MNKAMKKYVNGNENEYETKNGHRMNHGMKNEYYAYF